MTVTAHNIANATTPGFTRQRAILGTNVPLDVKPGQIGRGVQIKKSSVLAMTLSPNVFVIFKVKPGA